MKYYPQLLMDRNVKSIELPIAYLHDYKISLSLSGVREKDVQ